MNPDQPAKPEKTPKIISLPDGYSPELLGPLFGKEVKPPISLKGVGPQGEAGEWIFLTVNEMRFAGSWNLYSATAKFITTDGKEQGPFPVSCRISTELGKSFVKIF